MFRVRLACLLLAAALLLGLGCGAQAAEIDCDTVYCFGSDDFSSDESLTGICITGLPDANIGTVMLGSRVVKEGDILTAEQLTQMTFSPLRTEADRDAMRQAREVLGGAAGGSFQILVFAAPPAPILALGNQVLRS